MKKSHLNTHIVRYTCLIFFRKMVWQRALTVEIVQNQCVHKYATISYTIFMLWYVYFPSQPSFPRSVPLYAMKNHSVLQSCDSVRCGFSFGKQFSEFVVRARLDWIIFKHSHCSAIRRKSFRTIHSFFWMLYNDLFN